ncbi:conserved protein of unknown function [Agrobacterium pusense]|uniref:Uncharacterized protein n=1 Tax=Agrobacterium pusense TaxID=648995 RepID=U4Q430_9HYPH|nr:conserved protein of unknown function [Agrobacterium pusense]
MQQAAPDRVDDRQLFRLTGLGTCDHERSPRLQWSFFIQKKTCIRNGIRITTLKAARLQFFFMQLEKPFLAELRFAALLRGKPAPFFLENASTQNER